MRVAIETSDIDVDDDDTLVERALVDRAAFSALYTRYVVRVFQYLLTYTRSEDDAADITQVVFLRAFEALPSCRRQNAGSFVSWLFRIARNSAIDEHRQARFSLPWEHIHEHLLIFPGIGPESAAIQHEALNRLRILVAELNAERQELLAMRFAAGLTVGEIGAVTGKSEAAVRKQLDRTIHALKEQFDENEH